MGNPRKAKRSLTGRRKRPESASHQVTTWKQFLALVSPLSRARWIFRGQPKDLPLATRLERALKNWEVPLKHARKIEYEMIRDFRRRLSEPVYPHIQEDTLYCLALISIMALLLDFWIARIRLSSRLVSHYRKAAAAKMRIQARKTNRSFR